MNSTISQIHAEVRKRMESIQDAPEHETFRVWLHTIDDRIHFVYLHDIRPNDQEPDWTPGAEVSWCRFVYGNPGVMVSVNVNPGDNPVDIADRLIELNDEQAIQSQIP